MSWERRLVPDAQRFMSWGRFDAFLTAVMSAKALRTQLRIRGARNEPDETKAVFLRSFIARELRDQQLQSQLVPRSDGAVWTTSHDQVGSVLASVEAPSHSAPSRMSTSSNAT